LPRDKNIILFVQIQDHRPFASLQRGIRGMIPLWASRRIYSYHIRAIISQQHCHKRASQVMTEIEHL
jgi:hypothetical protein